MSRPPTALNAATPMPPPPLRVFISYAHEDKQLAYALHEGLSEHFGADMIDLWIDRDRLRAGFDIGEQLRNQLDGTDILIIVYTGQQKDSHSFTGVEVGYFQARRARRTNSRPCEIISIYLDKQPDPLTNLLGVPFGVSLSTFSDGDRCLENYIGQIDDGVAFSKFIRQLEEYVDKIRQDLQLPAIPRTASNRISTTKKILLHICQALKDRKQDEQLPQRKFVIEVPSGHDPTLLELPLDSVLRPNSPQATAIFGLPYREYKWSEFIAEARAKQRIGWKDVIEKVVRKASDLEDDNSQVIPGNGPGQLFRVFVTRSIKYLGGRREFHLYFLAYLQREEIGNPETTVLVAALDLCCRFRFMFFERGSPFSARSIEFLRSADPNVRTRKIRNKARDLVKELNILMIDAAAAKLDEPEMWGKLIDFQKVVAMSEQWVVIEPRIRAAVDDILLSSGEVPEGMRSELRDAIAELHGAFNESNAQLISELSKKLSDVTMQSLAETNTPGFYQ